MHCHWLASESRAYHCQHQRVEKATIFHENHDQDSAFAMASKAIELDPENPGSWHGLGNACFEAGEYAVSCYHDRNGNGKLDKNTIGIPVEPYGFSNDARGSFGPPKYKKARFNHDGGDMTIEVPLR